MAHVAAQVRSEHLCHEKLKRREATIVPRGSVEFHRYRPSKPRMKHAGPNSMPSLNMLAIQEDDMWELSSVRSLRSHSEYSTPTSTTSITASIFDIPSIGPWGTPSSSTHSFFIAELEDTSTTTVSKEMKHVDSPTRSLIEPAVCPSTASAVDNNTIMEENNRHLLERVVAAEDAATALRQQNVRLQKYVDYCKEQHRPKTAPSQAPSPTKPRSSRLASPTGPISTFNTQSLARTQLPLSHKKASPLGQPKLSISTMPQSPIRPSAPYTPPATPTHHPIHRPPPIIISHFSTTHEASLSDPSISSPIPGTVKRHPVTFGGTPVSRKHPVSTISLADAQRREKPLPVLTVLSPSVVYGFVEMGGRVEQSAWDAETEMDSEFGNGRDSRRKRVVRGLVRWAKGK